MVLTRACTETGTDQGEQPNADRIQNDHPEIPTFIGKVGPQPPERAAVVRLLAYGR